MIDRRSGLLWNCKQASECERMKISSRNKKKHENGSQARSRLYMYLDLELDLIATVFNHYYNSLSS